MSPRLAFAVRTAREAGDATLPWFYGDRSYVLKDNLTPVTDADLEAERLIRARITSEFPGEHVLGEEQGGAEGPSTRWVTDPIDGTKSFISGVPLFATLISYEVDGRPVLGVCYFPALDETLSAEVGEGAFWNGKPCRVSQNADLTMAVVSCGGHAAMVQAGRMSGFLNLASVCLATRTWCDAYGHALVATGRIDAMLDPRVSRWDISAMSVIVREAGGSFTDFQGRQALSDEAVSCSPSILPHVMGAFRN